MPITKEQLERRKNFIGSSDMAAILGLDPFRSAYDIYLSKTADLEDEKKVEHLTLGNEFEPIILARAEKQLGKLKPNVTCAPDDKSLPFESNVDAIALERDDNPVEAKMSGVFWPIAEVWGEPGTDQVPHRITVQCHVHMICTGKKLCYVPVLMWGLKSVMYEVPFDEVIADTIIEKGKDFWQNNVLAKMPPEDSIPSLDMIKRVRREPDKTVDVSDDTVTDWMASRDARLAAEKTEDKAKALLIAELGDADGGKSSKGMVTFYEQSSQRVDSEEIKLLFPGRYMKTTKHRVLRFKADKL